MFRMNSSTPFIVECPTCGERILEAELDKNDGVCETCNTSKSKTGGETMTKEELIQKIYRLCESCKGEYDGFNCPVQTLLDEID